VHVVHANWNQHWYLDLFSKEFVNLEILYIAI